MRAEVSKPVLLPKAYFHFGAAHMRMWADLQSWTNTPTKADHRSRSSLALDCSVTDNM